MGVFSRIVVVAPETVRLDLGDDQWVEIKRELNYGEMSDVAEATRGSLVKAQLQLIAAYIVDWSFVDGAGKRLPVESLTDRIGALRAMSTEAVAAIDAAVSAHVEAVKGEKKPVAPSGRRKSAATSSSRGR